MLCEEEETSADHILLLILVLVVVVGAFAALVKVWIKFPWRHVVRCAAQPCRILITYSQITTRKYAIAPPHNKVVCTGDLILAVWEQSWEMSSTTHSQ